MSTAFTLALKDLRLLTRAPMGLFWIFVFPLLFAFFFGSIFGGGEGGRGKMLVAVVDEDKTKGSEEFIDQLKKSPSLAIKAMAGAEARDAVRLGKVVGYIVIPKGYGAWSPLAGAQAPELSVGMDPARRVEKGYLYGLLMEAGAARMQTMFGGPKQQRQPVRVKEEEVTRERGGPRSAFEVTFPSAILWGLMGCVTGFSLSIVGERIGGTWLRLRTAPITRGAILAGKALACFVMCTLVAVVLLVIAVGVMGIRVDNPPALVLGVVCAAACFTGIMMFLSTWGKTEQGVAGAGWGILMPLAMIGGGMVPLLFMPSWMQTASNFSPVKWGIIALEGPIWRGYGFGDMLLPAGILLAIGAACFGLGVTWLSRQDG